MATAMQACLKGLMVKFNAKIGYTQSDEMCILIPPASVVRGEQQVHIRSGRAVKICTIAAGYVRTCDNNNILESPHPVCFMGSLERTLMVVLCDQFPISQVGGSKLPPPMYTLTTARCTADVILMYHIAFLSIRYVTAQFMAEVGKLSGLHDEVGEILPHFDCRIAAWDSWEEAKSLLLWRAYDCTSKLSSRPPCELNSRPRSKQTCVWGSTDVHRKWASVKKRVLCRKR